MSVDQLIAKALSTQSEDEAIACLRMARKRKPDTPQKTARPETPLATERWRQAADQWEKNAWTARSAAMDWRREAERQADMNKKLRQNLSTANSRLAIVSPLLGFAACLVVVLLF